MTAQPTLGLANPARQFDPHRASAARDAARARLWIGAMNMLVPATLLVLISAQTWVLAGDATIGAARWVLFAALALMLFLRPRGRIALRGLTLSDAFAGAFFLFAFASMIYSTVPSLTLQRTVSSILLYGAAFWTLWVYADLVGSQKLSDRLVTVAVIAFIAIVAAALISEDAWMKGRLRGPMGNPNAIGMLGTVFLPLAVAKYMRTRRAVDGFVILLMTSCVVLSGSRNGVLATALIVIFMLWRIRAWKAGLLIAAVATVIALAMPDYADTEGLLSRPGAGRLLSTDKLAAASGRTEAWQVAIPIIQQRLGFGYGFGTEELIFRDLKFAVHRGLYVHNSYLGLTYQLGLVGASLLFLPLLGLLAFRVSRRGRPTAEIAGYEAVLIGGLVACMVESWIYSAGNAFAFPFWISIMLLVRGASAAPVSSPWPAAPTRATSTAVPRRSWPALPPESSKREPRRFDPPASLKD